MQYYQQPGYQPSAPYQATTGSPTTPTVMTNANGLPPLQHAGMDLGGASQHAQSKRKQVKNACTNCQKACKKCDDARPCPRCVKYGIADTCINSVRKERKKGIKRGPYKRRQKQEGEPKTTTRKSDVGDQQSQYAHPMRAPLAFGYPNNLHQYGSSYDPYGQYAAYHKDQIMPQPFYPYPVLMPGQQDGQQHPYHHHQQQQQHQHQQPPQQQQHSPMPQHFGGVMNQHSPQSSRSMVQGEDHIHSPQTAQVYYQHNQSQPASQRSSPHLQEVKAQPMTPVPSTSTSTVTTSSPPESAS